MCKPRGYSTVNILSAQKLSLLHESDLVGSLGLFIVVGFRATLTLVH